MIETQSDENLYFAAKQASDTASVLLGKINDWCNNIESNGYLDKLKRAYAAYHGAYYSDTGNGHQITFGGEQGELVQLPVNHYANIAQHMIVMTCANRPAMECRASNTDYKSQAQTMLAKNILEYYLREKRLEIYLKKSVEMAVTLGAGFLMMEWDDTKGELVDYIEETKTKIYEGDLVFTNLSPFDVVMDSSKESQDHDWVLVRIWKNKYDLAAKYPELKDKILAMPTKSDLNKFRLSVTNLTDQTDDVQVLLFFHKRTDCMQDGRYMMFLSEDIILQDLPMPYRILPVFRVAPRDILGTPFGYTQMFDLLPLQEMLNSLYSAGASNLNAFGVQNVLVPRGCDIAINQLVGGLNVIEYNAQAGAKPEALQICQSPAELYKMVQMLETVMETISGINSVARGNPEASLKSGTALALVQSMALQFMSGLQQAYVELIENVGTAMIKILQDFAHTPRLVAIAGRSNRTYMKEFSSKDISNITRVIVNVGNPMAQTTAGRVQMAQELIQYSSITPKQYISLLHTGNLDELTEQIEHDNLLMRAENEALQNGMDVIVSPIDKHSEHIDYHSAVLADPDFRLNNPELVERVNNHIQEHIDALRNTDPALLQMRGQQPLPPLQPPMGPEQGGPPEPGAPTESTQNATQGVNTPPEQGILGPGIEGGRVIGPGMVEGARIPAPATPPPPFENLPTNPAEMVAQ